MKSMLPICRFVFIAAWLAWAIGSLDVREANGQDGVKLIVLGVAQDAGFPQAACRKDCCADAWKDATLRRHVTCVAIVDEASGQRWLFDCTPDFPQQVRMLDEAFPSKKPGTALDGILLTHAHIGHYAGLIHLGREVIGANSVPVYAMPRMGKFLKSNGPWSQLVSLNNISINGLENETSIQLNDQITVTPFQVPHRDEFSETVGFKIKGPNQTAVFLPDIDKWSKWNQKIEEVVRGCDVAYLDGTFFDNGEIPGRDMSLIPHPFVSESIARFSSLEKDERSKIRFIHFNHTNPVLQPNHPAKSRIERAGMSVASEGEIIDL
ncbi:MBL fold metallo-hydrolase [Mariniblastus fucicola]|uniref:Coenzyme PQQ synthesis protein B n=1 Tax=Mariniblastus fucicola TaxID=980251 RepID=A0A5B9PAG3_9BACT|nr:MBL fold metallo-hydrolase [Mariniblastus fucicola]QEG22215.1 Coenzyme PQQ synthesis protein B [Mariniblastus fucicola]